MARANPDLIAALRQTAGRLSGAVSYQWGHMGMCNCSDPAVLRRAGRRLRFNRRDDVVLYMRSWADLLEESVAVAQCVSASS